MLLTEELLPLIPGSSARPKSLFCLVFFHPFLLASITEAACVAFKLSS